MTAHSGKPSVAWRWSIVIGILADDLTRLLGAVFLLLAAFACFVLVVSGGNMPRFEMGCDSDGECAVLLGVYVLVGAGLWAPATWYCRRPLAKFTAAILVLPAVAKELLIRGAPLSPVVVIFATKMIVVAWIAPLAILLGVDRALARRGARNVA